MSAKDVPIRKKDIKKQAQLIEILECSDSWDSEEAERQRILCHSCGWKNEFEKYTWFEPTLKVIYGAGTRGVWTVGTKYILKERIIDDPNPHDGKAGLEFVCENTKIPVPKIAMQWVDGKKVYTLMERVAGRSLEQLFEARSVSGDDLELYAQETAGYLDQLREFTAESVGWLSGKPYNEQIVARNTHIHHGEKEEYFANWSGNEIQ
ncbi:hypothetical protein MMC14_001645 [Varicellaria rhodocarpa]|nr:hypothetical protein [Varicellaria rhodocarpa]